ncbi:MAG: glycosyltransferase family 4 protein [Leptolyngbyaceae cyanobacterium MO_188.B28]|nr:glycosyltransferase family 4 protein [Leptolyngbyaceae cyanobacterium MO_188.B28]
MTTSLTTLLTIVGLTFTLSKLSVNLIRKYLQNQLLDIPNERSSHTRPTPRGGGLGFIIAFAIAFAITQAAAPNLTVGIPPLLWPTLIPLVAIGMLDDWRSLSSGVRYLVQLSVAVAVVNNCGPFPVPGLDKLGAPGLWLAVGLTVIGVTALINFYNFMDGLDGLVAGVSAVQLGFLALWLQQPVLWLWVAALIGFLYWNWSPAKIFMGDAGSTTLGAIVGISLLSHPQPDLGLSWTTLAILSPLVGDAVYTLCRRLLQGENIFQAHRSHLYQRLHQAGWPHAHVAGLYVALTLAIAIGLAQFGASAAWVTLAVTPPAIALTEAYLARPSQPKTYKTPQLVNED